MYATLNTRLFAISGLCAALLLATQAGCPVAPVDPESAYLAAIQDAAIATPEEISNDLTAITDYNSELIWSDTSADKKLLVVTWTSWTGYDDSVGQEMELAVDVWVTVAPEAQTFCRNQRVLPANLTLRLEQLLGLPPGDGKTTFVELWVDPDDLFRPSPDPEISDREAELAFPMSADFIAVAESHIAWFNDLLGTSYGSDGYPWTRLGYTYDWGNPVSEVGLSEFVIQQGASVTVHSVSDTQTYCRWW